MGGAGPGAAHTRSCPSIFTVTEPSRGQPGLCFLSARPWGWGTGRLPCTAPVSYLCFLGPPVKGSTCLGVLSSASVSGGPSPSVGKAPWELMPHQKQAATCCHLGMRHLEMPEIGRNLKFWRGIKVVLFVRVAQTKPCAGHTQCTGRALQPMQVRSHVQLRCQSPREEVLFVVNPALQLHQGPGSGNKKDLQLSGRVLGLQLCPKTRAVRRSPRSAV